MCKKLHKRQEEIFKNPEKFVLASGGRGGLTYSHKLMLAFAHAKLDDSSLTLRCPDVGAKLFMEKRIRELHLHEVGVVYKILIGGE